MRVGPTHRLLRRFWLRRRRAVNGQFQRTIPFGDYVVDRWERAAELGFGEGSSVYDSCLILGDVHVGHHSWIGPFTVLDGSGGLEIGPHCTVSAGAQIYSHDSVDATLTSGAAAIERRRSVIGANCYIGPNTVVAMGVRIGDGAVIGANSLVLTDIPAGARAHGTPCRVVRSAGAPPHPESTP